MENDTSLHLAHFGLPRISPNIIALQAKSINAKIDSVHLFFWPSNTADQREQVLSTSILNSTDIESVYKSIYPHSKIYNHSKNADDIQIVLKKIDSSINALGPNLPSENWTRPKTFQISTYAILSQIVARIELLKHIAELIKNGKLILTRPDVILDSQVKISDLNFSLESKNQKIIVPMNGNHYDGINDQFWYTNITNINKIIYALYNALIKIFCKQEIKIEKIFLDSLLEENFSILRFNRKSIIFRNGRFKDSSAGLSLAPEINL